MICIGGEVVCRIHVEDGIYELAWGGCTQCYCRCFVRHFGEPARGELMNVSEEQAIELQSAG